VLAPPVAWGLTGQNAVVAQLRRAIERAHAYLFSGPPGAPLYDAAGSPAPGLMQLAATGSPAPGLMQLAATEPPLRESSVRKSEPQ